MKNDKKKTGAKKPVKPAPKPAAKAPAKPAPKPAPKTAPKETAKAAPKPAAKKDFPRVQLSGLVGKPARPGGLGRGLGALIGRDQTRNVAAVDPVPEAAAPRPASAAVLRQVVDVAVARIVPSPWQPRKNFDTEEAQRTLGELAASIRVHGVIQPLVCRKGADGFFELIGGERRLRAAGMAGLGRVPVIVLEAADRDAAELALVENLQREDLNAVEEAEAYRALIEKFKLTQDEVAERVGKGRSSVANALRLLELPDDVKQLLGAGVLSLGHAKVILGVEGDAQRVELASECVRTGMSVRALEKKIASLKAAKTRKPPVSDLRPADLSDLLKRLHAKFATPVRLVPSATYANGRHARGRIEIDYFDNDDLSRLLELFGIDVNDLDD